MIVRFYRNHAAFPHTRNEDDELRVMVRLDDDPSGDGCDYEFGIVQVMGQHSGWLIGLQLRVFDDAWRVFQDLPEFVALLSRFDQSEITGDRRYLQDLDSLIPAILELGWQDTTSKYADETVHVQGCLTCGVRHD